jgi:hypothetical protein
LEQQFPVLAPFPEMHRLGRRLRLAAGKWYFSQLGQWQREWMKRFHVEKTQISLCGLKKSRRGNLQL